MNFQDLHKIEDYKFYIDAAFKQSKKAGNIVYIRSNGDKISRIRTAEYEKVKIFARILKEKLDAITKNFPSIDGLPEFYQELVRTTIDYVLLKKSLGSIAWASQSVVRMSDEYQRKMKHTSNEADIKRIMNSYYGRISSILKQIRSGLEYLEESRKIMKTYPAIKTDLFTVAITGFPNIGKSTLLSKITPAKPEIKAYAFTTKGINLGYLQVGIHKIQFIDTPGVLARDKRNNIEEQAYLVLKYAANIIVYVIDLTEPYPLKVQEKLFKGLKDYDKPMLVYFSKNDIISKTSEGKAMMDKYMKKYRAVNSMDELQKKIEKQLKKNSSSF
jgi:nucleolar GTP-binding protein